MISAPNQWLRFPYVSGHCIGGYYRGITPLAAAGAAAQFARHDDDVPPSAAAAAEPAEDPADAVRTGVQQRVVAIESPWSQLISACRRC
jgi:hypothetical protein